MRKLKLVVAAAVATVVGLASAEPVDSYNGLVSAINGAAAGSTIKLKEGATITVGAQVDIRKALTLSGGWIDDETPGGAKTILSGGGTKDIVAARVANIEFENIKFTAAGQFAIYRENNQGGYLNIRHCDFIDNVSANSNNKFGGLAIYGNSGNNAATMTVEDCVFDNNATTSEQADGWDLHSSSPNGNMPFGLVVVVKNYKSATFERCVFTRNGVNFDHRITTSNVGYGDGRSVWGSTMGIWNTPVTLSRCSFVANRGSVLSANGNYSGGIVYLAGACGGSSVRNCLFVGNEELCRNKASVGPNGYAQYHAGALVFNLSNGVSAEVDGCTFAYNLSETSRSAAGLTVHQGAVTVRNAIFYKNRRHDNGKGGADLTVKDGASANVSFSFFTDNTTASVANDNGVAYALGAGVQYGDPLFVTSLTDVSPLIVDGDSTMYFDTDKSAELMATDVHLKSTQGTYADGAWVTYDVDSTAIDAGDPMADFVDEPVPNGKRLNAGAYGNTDEASKSESKEVALPTIESATITFPGGYTHPQANVLLGCEDPEADYSATVTITFKVGGETVASTSVYDQHPGDTATYLLPRYFQPGTEITMEVAVTVAGSSDVVTCDPVVEPARGVLPPGGPANVVHVRAGADGSATGENWVDAFPSLASAIAMLSDKKTEIWVSGSFTVTSKASLAPTTGVAIRGGFAGTESSADDRAEDAVATVSGHGESDILVINNAEGLTVTLERLKFTGAYEHAVRKLGSHGDLVISKCVFADNVVEGAKCGAALYMRGNTDKVQASSKSTLTIEDCLFRNNCSTSMSTDNGDEEENYGPIRDGWGGGIYGRKSGIAVRIAGFKKVTIARCEFEANGVPFGFRQWGGGVASCQGLGSWNSLFGSTMCIHDAPVTLTECSFRANRGSTPRTSGNPGSGVVHIGGASGGSLIQNCLFVGNEELSSARDALGPTEWFAQYESGALVLALNAGLSAEVNGCTFAYNLCETSRSAGGLTINSGDVTVRNSVFYGNKRATKGVGGADLTVRSENNASVQVSYSFFTDNTTASVADDLGEAIVFGAGIQYGDPLFVSPLVAFESLVTTANPSRYFAPETLDDVLALDVHLKSRTGTYVDGAWTAFDVSSPAIDAGDPASSHANEPKPNGHRVNMGGYGNTAYASRSKLKGLLLLVK